MLTHYESRTSAPSSSSEDPYARPSNEVPAASKAAAGVAVQGASQDTAGACDALASATAASLGILTAAMAVALGVAELAFDFTTLSTVGKALSERFEG